MNPKNLIIVALFVIFTNSVAKASAESVLVSCSGDVCSKDCGPHTVKMMSAPDAVEANIEISKCCQTLENVVDTSLEEDIVSCTVKVWGDGSGKVIMRSNVVGSWSTHGTCMEAAMKCKDEIVRVQDKSNKGETGGVPTAGSQKQQKREQRLRTVVTTVQNAMELQCRGSTKQTEKHMAGELEVCKILAEDNSGNQTVCYSYRSLLKWKGELTNPRGLIQPSYAYPECWDETIEEYLDDIEMRVGIALMRNPGTGRTYKKFCRLSECRANGKDDSYRSYKLWMSQEPIQVLECTICQKFNFPKECKVTVRSTNTYITVQMESTVGSYEYKLGSVKRVGEFLQEREERIEILKPGKHILIGHCNDMVYSRKIMITSKEFCEEQYLNSYNFIGMIYCGHHKAVNILFLILGISLVFYFLAYYVAITLGLLTSLILLSVTWFLSKKITCDICCKLVLMKKSHRCDPSSCIYCGAKLMTQMDIQRTPQDTLKRMLKDHYSCCNKMISHRPWFMCLIGFYRNSTRTYRRFGERIPKIGAAICIIWLMAVLIPGAESADNRLASCRNRLNACITKLEQNATVIQISQDNGTQCGTKKDMEGYKWDIINVVDAKFNKYYKFNSDKYEKDYKKNLGSEKILVNPLMSFKKCHSTLLAISIAPIIVGALFTLIIGRFVAKRITLKNAIKGHVTCLDCRDQYGCEAEHHCPNKNVIETCYHQGARSESEEPSPGINIEDTITSGARLSPRNPVIRTSVRVVKIERDTATRKLKREMDKTLWGIMSCIYTIATPIIIISCFMCAESYDHMMTMKKIDSDLGTFIMQLEKSEFHPYHARFSGVARESISSVEQKMDCSHGKCIVKLNMEADIVGLSGREFGYKVCPKDDIPEIKGEKCTELNVKVNSLTTLCSYKSIYKTGKPKHHSLSTDTCTRNCGDCLSDISIPIEVKSDIYESKHADTSSWSCDGPGCMSINTGCTCGKCWCDAEEEVEVMELTNESSMIQLCVQVGGQGFCKTAKEEENTQFLRILKYDGQSDNCPKIIAKFPNGISKKGQINSFGEFSDKFGALQITSDGKIGTKREERYSEQCLFAKARFFDYDQCCKDTWEMKETLETIEWKEEESNNFAMSMMKLGVWRVRIEMPPMTFIEEEDKVKIENIKISNCGGCFSCNEGGSCMISYKSNYDITTDISCTGCRLDTSVIHINKGVKKSSFNVFCKEKAGNLSCSIMKGQFQGNGVYSLVDEPKHPHGDGEINMDSKRTVHEECDGWFCGLHWPEMPFMSIFKWVLIAIILIVVIWLLYQFFKFLYRFLKTTEVELPRRWKNGKGQ